MKKHLLLTSVAIGLAVGLASALSAVAATDGVYPAMIREDRVWEYLWTRVESKKTDKPTDCELFRMRFDGTEEKNGKEYHRFVYCGDRVKWRETTDKKTGAVTSTDKVVTPNDNPTVYHLREELGRVFVLFPYDRCHEEEYFAEKGEEILLYDFTLGEGESFAGFWSTADYIGGLIDYPVRELEPIDIAGNRRRVFGVTDSFRGACDGYRFAEEAGCLNFGTLAAPDATMRINNGVGFYCDLQKIYDGDGNVIYDARMAPYTDIVDGSKNWTYNHLEVHSTLKSLTPGSTYSFGETETVDETEYLPLMCDGERTGMLMRQDGLRVYVRFEKGKAPSVLGYPAEEDCDDRDLPVYDIGADVGDTYHALTVGEGNFYEWVELRVTETGTLTTLSGERNCIKVVRNDVEDRRCDTVVDGIGSLSGVFFTADLGPELTSGYDKEILYDVTGKEGDVLYKGNAFTIGREMVAEGRVWEFYCSEGSQNPCPQQELYRWQFSGTAEKDGRTWNRLMRVGSVKWRGSDPESAVVDDTVTEVALMRQEDNRVWVLDNAGERLIYDFNAQPRDVMSFSPAYLDVVYEYRLEDIAYRYSDLGVSGFYNFTPCVETTLSPYTYSSHWGNIGRGDMLHPEFETQTDGAPVRCLRNVYDLEGKVLYKGADIEVPTFAVVETVTTGHSLRRDGDRVVAEGEGELTLRLLAADGRRAGTASGSGKVSLSLDGMAPGLYIATVSGSGRPQRTLRIIL